MKKIILLLCLALVFCLGAGAALADEGEHQVRALFTAFRDHDWAKVDAMTAPAFQSVHEDGPRDRATELRLVRGLKLNEYELTSFHTTYDGPVMVVTYRFAGVEHIDGKRVVNDSAQRLTVFIKSGDKWLWLAHANLAPLK